MRLIKMSRFVSSAMLIILRDYSYRADMVYLFNLGCCNECLMQYMIEKKTCFICNAAIEGVENIDINK
jgi:hypothetical protein